jgi:hypothetical protein
MFFIVGTGRSGTTLLQAMLMSHPRIFIPPETRYFGVTDPDIVLGGTARGPGDDDRYLDAAIPDWTRREFGIEEADLRAAIGATDLSTRKVFLTLARLWAIRSGKPRIGEKTPNHEKSIGRICAVFPGARFIQMIRDPRDVVVSKRDHRLQGHGSVVRYARSMRKVYDRDAEYGAALPASVYTRVRYEDLIAHPESELRRICAFLGEEFDPAMLRYHERPDAGFAGFEREWKGLTLAPLTASRIGRYREKLTAREIRTVERTIGPHLHRLGYTPDPGVPHRFDWWVRDSAEYLVWRIRRNLRRDSGGAG